MDNFHKENLKIQVKPQLQKKKFVVDLCLHLKHPTKLSYTGVVGQQETVMPRCLAIPSFSPHISTRKKKIGS